VQDHDSCRYFFLSVRKNGVDMPSTLPVLFYTNRSISSTFFGLAFEIKRSEDSVGWEFKVISYLMNDPAASRRVS